MTQVTLGKVTVEVNSARTNGGQSTFLRCVVEVKNALYLSLIDNRWGSQAPNLHTNNLI